jgi:hypothetical protein
MEENSKPHHVEMNLVLTSVFLDSNSNKQIYIDQENNEKVYVVESTSEISDFDKVQLVLKYSQIYIPYSLRKFTF